MKDEIRQAFEDGYDGENDLSIFESGWLAGAAWQRKRDAEIARNNRIKENNDGDAIYNVAYRDIEKTIEKAG